MNDVIKKLKKLNRKAAKQLEIPVSAIILKNNKVISYARNKRNKTNNVLDHAEIIAIRKANRKLKSWKLDECIMFVSLEPCPMCKEIIKQSRIKEVNYFLGNKKTINYKTKFNLINDVDDKYFEKEIKMFFKDIR